MASAPHAESEKAAMADIDVERTGARENSSGEHGPEHGHEPVVDSDDGSTFKQDGVKEIEALTSTWSKKTMWLMMAL